MVSPAAVLLCATLTASPEVTVFPAEARPGDAVLVTVRGVKTAPQGTVAGRPVLFFSRGREQQAVVGLPVETALGPLEFSLELPAEDGVSASAQKLTAHLDVVDPGFPAKELKVNPKFTGEPPPEVQRQLEADRAAFAEAFKSANGAAPRFSRGFDWPRTSKITAPFGDKRVFNGSLQSQHFGIDLDGKTGAPISAANDGEVVLARDCYMSGQTVIVDHGAGLFSLYFHMSKMLVKTGDMVHRGQRLGLVGRTGRVTGPHLHWSMKIGDLYVDPASILRLPLAKAAEASRKGTP